MQAMLVEGMHGLGDCIHQRGIIPQLMGQYNVYLVTSWPCIFYDLIERGLKVVNRPTVLNSQTKNAKREMARFVQQLPFNPKLLRIAYPPSEVRRCGSVLGAMCAVSGVAVERADFRLPIPEEWKAKARVWLDRWRPSKPIMLFRPLIDRKVWTGARTRNPSQEVYSRLFDAIRQRYFVVSVADADPPHEWIVFEGDADAKCNAGELDIETIAALASQASLVFTSPGFATILAQAVGSPCITIFGGYERAYSFNGGAHFNRSICIEPNMPCDCFRHDCACTKATDIPRALDKVGTFLDDLADSPAIGS